MSYQLISFHCIKVLMWICAQWYRNILYAHKGTFAHKDIENHKKSKECSYNYGDIKLLSKFAEFLVLGIVMIGKVKVGDWRWYA